MLTKIPNKGTTSGHVLYMPDNYDPAKKWPVVLFFHGIGERGDGSDSGLDNLYKFIDSPWYPWMAQLKKDRFIFIAIQLPWSVSYWPLKYVDDSLTIARQYSIDENKMYLTGVSLGGGAVWGYPVASPENGQKFAAILACCCIGVTGNFANIKSPVLAYHAKNDPIVAPSSSETIVNAIKAAGGTATFKNIGSGHEIWGLVYGNNEGWDWLLAQAKAGTPEPLTPVKDIFCEIDLADGKRFTLYMDKSYELK